MRQVRHLCPQAGVGVGWTRRLPEPASKSQVNIHLMLRMETLPKTGQEKKKIIHIRESRALKQQRPELTISRGATPTPNCFCSYFYLLKDSFLNVSYIFRPIAKCKGYLTLTVYKSESKIRCILINYFMPVLV